MDCQRLVFTGHALRRMFERELTVEQVREVLRTGEEIMLYPDDRPFPSRLVLGFVESVAVHALAAPDGTGTCHVITAYCPDPSVWTDDFRQRR